MTEVPLLDNGQTGDMRDCDKTSGWRGSRAGWLAVARSALLCNGVEAVKIQPLAAELNLSRTSFYWFFKDRQALLDALLEDWDVTNTRALIAACDLPTGTVAEAVLNLIGVFLDGAGFESTFDFAVRSWAHQDGAVMARVKAADAARLAAICALFERYDFDAAEADVRARTVYLVQIGYIAMQVEEPMGERLARIPAYVKTYCGATPTPQNMAAFITRYGLDTGSHHSEA